MTTQSTAKKKNAVFLAVLAESGNVTEACRQAKLDRSGVYKLKDRDEVFAEAWEHAEEEAGDSLEAEAWRRAKGWEENVYKDGELAGTTLRYSDTLLIFLLKGNKPDKFKDRAEVQHKGKVVFRMNFGDGA